MRTCPDCGQSKSPEHYAVDLSRPSGQRLYCKPCDSKRNKAYRARVRAGHLARLAGGAQ